MATIDIRDLSVVYENPRDGTRLHAVDKVTLQVGHKEFIALLGPSGCGKTSLLSVIDGLVAPTSGSVLVDGAPIQGPGPDRAMVFQEYGLLPWRTVRKNIKFGLEVIQGRKESAEDTRLIDSTIELLGLAGFEDKYPHELSGGMQQRVGLARALVLRPNILLMDEPFAALDAITRETMQKELLHLMDGLDQTILFVTHSIDEALLLADRIVVFSKRPTRIVEILKPDLPTPRWHAGIKTLPQYVQLREHIWELLTGTPENAGAEGPTRGGR